MDTEIPELGPGAEPADCPVRGTAHRIPVKRKAGVAARSCAAPARLIPSAFVLLPEIPRLIPEARCGRCPQDFR